MEAGESGGEGGGGHDAGGMMRWLLTYADMITLLMAFFIMMYSMSVMNQEKFSKAAASLRVQFGPRGGAAAVGGTPSGRVVRVDRSQLNAEVDLGEEIEAVEEQLREYVEENDLEEVVRTERRERGLVISVVSDNLLFAAGEAELRPAALKLVQRIAGLLRGLPNAIAVEGHTCDLPIRTPRFPSNWELSAARSCSVVRYLIDEEGIARGRLIATGFADSRPAASNATQEGRERNRRVDIVILAQGLSEEEGTKSEREP